MKISAGIVPPSTGAPPYSVCIGVTEFAWPTQTAIVTSLFAPTNQASPLFSVVPVLPQRFGSPVLALRPVPEVTTLWRSVRAVVATSGGTTCFVSTLS